MSRLEEKREKEITIRLELALKKSREAFGENVYYDATRMNLEESQFNPFYQVTLFYHRFRALKIGVASCETPYGSKMHIGRGDYETDPLVKLFCDTFEGK